MLSDVRSPRSTCFTVITGCEKHCIKIYEFSLSRLSEPSDFESCNAHFGDMVDLIWGVVSPLESKLGDLSDALSRLIRPRDTGPLLWASGQPWVDGITWPCKWTGVDGITCF